VGENDVCCGAGWRPGEADGPLPKILCDITRETGEGAVVECGGEAEPGPDGLELLPGRGEEELLARSS